MFKSPNRRTVLFSIAAFPLTGCVHPERSTTTSLSLDDIIRNQTAARGGAEALDRVRAVLIEVEIVERGQTLRGRYAAESSGLVRIDIRAEDNLVYSEGVDRQGVWLWPRSEPAPRASAAEGSANALTNGAEGHLFGLHRFADRGHRLRLMPPETIDGTEYQVVEIAFTTGHISYFYIDPSTWLTVRRRDQRAYHPDLSLVQQRIETIFSDFQTVDGIVAAHRNVDVDLGTGAILSTNQMISRTINPILPAGVFDRTYTPS